MSDVAVQQGTGVYEPSLFGTYSKKIGMWLFLLSDSLTFGALLYAYTYGRVSTPNCAKARTKAPIGARLPWSSTVPAQSRITALSMCGSLD